MREESEVDCIPGVAGKVAGEGRYLCVMIMECSVGCMASECSSMLSARLAVSEGESLRMLLARRSIARAVESFG